MGNKMTDEARVRILKFIRETQHRRKRSRDADGLTLREAVVERFGVSPSFASQLIKEVHG